MTMALITKNKLGFIDDTLPCLPSIDSLYNSWLRRNSMVISWIVHYVSKEIVDSIMYIDNVANVQIDLHYPFHQSNRPCVFHIKQLLNGLFQGSNDVNSYYTKFKTLWVELKDFGPIPTFTCGGMKSLMEQE